jgi:hypothetical protein
MVSCDTCDELVGALEIGHNLVINAKDGNLKVHPFG